jgi:hypothetical protein
MRAVAAKQYTELDIDKRDELELIRLKLYDRLYHRQRQTIRIDRGGVTAGPTISGRTWDRVAAA